MITPKTSAALAWYRAEDWPRWKAISEDGMDNTYEEWLKEARQAVLTMTHEGMIIHRAVIAPDEFLKWAKSHRKRNNSASRSEYAIVAFERGCGSSAGTK